ncbi:biotin-dependent acyl-CoA carboxylase, biotin carboxylase subunit [Geotalea daltonii FRC-32]|uniref:Biotin-dependent acyl-CoA carboxylase, biotin carboxylase subunit n=1 Tax=Geotalea daltonii (strain DSM 22248 / JCM 15807 / FRC-32) TaxID=316067 RepID=B9M1Q4_GEODF|nr:biotin/lipoyl-containing protein [Geotalea daltonii]ACM19200.1 biotin-dependent acyl-CoA carboxylase, biotin carboxylase subunit [Geotalea daltonii FRC-32]
MKQTSDYYIKNPLIHKDRRLGKSPSDWVSSFSCEDLKPLIVCRGPIRKEAMDVYEEMGITHYGILLSEKDSIVYPNALAPELRQLTDSRRVHRVPDYTGASKEERVERIHQIISIAKDNSYDSIFAGYGFMAEDDEFVAAIEAAGLKFIGPCSATQAGAGKKDEAKRTALTVNVSVTPGIDNVTARTLLKKHPTREKLLALVKSDGFKCDEQVISNPDISLEDLADQILYASYVKGVDLFSIEELCAQVQAEVADMFRKYPQSRIRLKAIGGGGGKGQRILGASLLPLKKADDKAIAAAAAEAPTLVREILNEVKANGIGDNKNVLIELNIEQTRHNEIQLLGNGDWCIALGGRDCSLQMHEQKLLEVSVTQEGLMAAIERAKAAGNKSEAKALESDLKVLKRMEEESERFGRAVGLDSASTFECIVDRDRHFFMEVNTRIQVEHRVTELCYNLKFTNPKDKNDFFVVESLVEAMALLARHKERLPKPERLVRFNASVEARLNATDDSLSPHAGGMIRYWSKPIDGEIRDDQGISMLNPDTGIFVKYKVAGAYDSNIALLLTKGEDRRDSYERMSEVIRSTTLRGSDLATNLEFHYGLVNWFLGTNVMAKPTTRFVVPYLTLVGTLKEEANKLDPVFAFLQMKKHYAKLIAEQFPDDPKVAKNMSSLLDRKGTLITRPMERLLGDPHLLSGWLSMNTKNFRIDNGKVVWLRNPLGVLNDTYDYLHMSFRPHKPAAEVIWGHDNELLQEALSFSRTLREKLGLQRDEYFQLCELLQKDEPQGGMDAATWEQVRSAHFGYEAGLELLGMLFLVGVNVKFWDLRVEEDLEITIPEYLTDPDLQARMKKVLVPPPATKADEIVSVCGGMYYAQEAPGMPAFVEEGMHFDKGQPLYIIEVMKMFNKVNAPFSGTIDKILIQGGDGTIVQKGQPLFKVTPDEKFVEVDPNEIEREKRTLTTKYLKAVL